MRIVDRVFVIPAAVVESACREPGAVYATGAGYITIGRIGRFVVALVVGFGWLAIWETRKPARRKWHRGGRVGLHSGTVLVGEASHAAGLCPHH
ncbi:hypothetical protein [Mycolicibacterium moriokaense]|uniref:hypothetical protein n=1 Tax=Mycolicibacterium moriokaense TaxID=39691 RepID=UPI0011B7F3CE|nr:hypothetical protein [Mycolicibacterium moriokaense]